MRVVARMGAWLLAAAAVLPCAAQADDGDIYLYRQNGVRTYTDRKPNRQVAYVTLTPFGRPTAVASCVGLSAAALDARAATYHGLISQAAATHRVPAALVRAVMRVESCFDRRAVSTAGARGLMQLMPQTAAELGVHDSFDAAQNIDGGTRYLRMMLDRFKENRELALAAYNAGPQAVDHHHGVPPFPETMKYVKRVLASYRQQLS